MIPNWMLEQMHRTQSAEQRDVWLDLHWWCWRRWLLLRMVPRRIFDRDDTVVTDSAKLVDVAIRDQVRRIHRMLQETGTPAIPPGDASDTVSQKPGYHPRPSKRVRCRECGHVNFTDRCACACHMGTRTNPPL